MSHAEMIKGLLLRHNTIIAQQRDSANLFPGFYAERNCWACIVMSSWESDIAPTLKARQVSTSQVMKRDTAPPRSNREARMFECVRDVKVGHARLVIRLRHSS